MNATSNAVTAKLQTLLVRIEEQRISIKAEQEIEKQIFAEAKGEGFDVKIMREILRYRQLDLEDFQEYEQLRLMYLLAAGLKKTVVVDADEVEAPDGRVY